MIRDVAKEHNFQIVFWFCVTVSPQLWSDAEQSVEQRQVFRSHIQLDRLEATVEHMGCLSLTTIRNII